ncbi:hypothetical protein JCM12178A_03600 [Salidesulfovibrio brasiliensis]
MFLVFSGAAVAVQSPCDRAIAEYKAGKNFDACIEEAAPEDGNLLTMVWAGQFGKAADAQAEAVRLGPGQGSEHVEMMKTLESYRKREIRKALFL